MTFMKLLWKISLMSLDKLWKGRTFQIQCLQTKKYLKIYYINSNQPKTSFVLVPGVRNSKNKIFNATKMKREKL